MPALGNVNRKNMLKAYGRVGRILALVFAAEDRLEHIQVTGLDDEETRLNWLRRFLP